MEKEINEQNYAEKISKQHYKMIIETIAKNLNDRADDILNDWDKGIYKINIKATISLDCVPTLSVEKEYSPWRAK